MDSQPLPQTSSTGYSARDRGGAGEGRAFASSSWERSGAGTSGGSGMGSSMGGGSSFGGYSEIETRDNVNMDKY